MLVTPGVQMVKVGHICYLIWFVSILTLLGLKFLNVKTCKGLFF